MPAWTTISSDPAPAVEQMRGLLWSLLQGGLQHRKHWRDPDAPRDEHRRRFGVGGKEKLSGRRPDLQDCSGLRVVMQPVLGNNWAASGLFGGATARLTVMR
jgi:hypothetical protein